MAKDPAVLFYTSDFLSGTAFFTKQQRGEYITLLCEQHQLWSIPEEHMVEVCSSLESPVVKKFVRDEDGNYYNERMREETVKRRSFCESRKKSINKRYVRSTHVEHTKVRMEDGNENRIIDGISSLEGGAGGVQNLFGVWWLSYPKKQHRDVAMIQFEKILGGGIATPFQLTNACQRYNAYCMLKFDDYPDSQYIKFPENWLRDNCWTIDWKKSVDKEIKRQSVAFDKKSTGGRAVYEYERNAANKYEGM
jgi:hypothetical protein